MGWPDLAAGGSVAAAFTRQFCDSRASRHASVRPHFGRRLGSIVQPVGYSCGPADPRAVGFPRRGKPPSVRAAGRPATHAAVARSAPICPNMPRARRCACSSPWRCRCCSPSPMRRWRRRTSRPSASSFRCSIFCNRCRSWASSRSPWCSSWRSLPGACWAPNSRRSSRFLPARPGTWRSASTSRCARYRPSWSRRRAISG